MRARSKAARARIAYALGWCYHQMEPPNLPEAMRAWSDALKLGGIEGQAAGLRLGNVRLTSDPAQALADWKFALESVSQPKDYQNPYVSIANVCDWFDRAIDQFQEAH